MAARGPERAGDVVAEAAGQIGMGVLSAQQERDLVVAAERGDAEARTRLVEAYLPAIAGLAYGFHRILGVERQELLQEGVAGLLVAARRYDDRLNVPFWGYASFWVRKAMQELVAQRTRPVALSDRAVRALARIRAARREHVQAHGREPTSEELSRATGLTAAQLERLQATERRPRALEEHVRGDGEGTTTVADTIADPGAEHAYEEVLDSIEVRQVRRLADRLEERERVVLFAHYGLGKPAETLNEIASALGLTAERARQIEVGALAKLRESRSASPPS